MLIDDYHYYCYYSIFQQRHRTDRQVNNRKSQVLRKGYLVEEKWHRVQVSGLRGVFLFFFYLKDRLLSFWTKFLLCTRIFFIILENEDYVFLMNYMYGSLNFNKRKVFQHQLNTTKKYKYTRRRKFSKLK